MARQKRCALEGSVTSGETPVNAWLLKLELETDVVGLSLLLICNISPFSCAFDFFILRMAASYWPTPSTAQYLLLLSLLYHTGPPGDHRTITMKTDEQAPCEGDFEPRGVPLNSPITGVIY